MIEVVKGSSGNKFTEIILVNETGYTNDLYVIKGAYSLLMHLKINQKNKC